MSRMREQEYEDCRELSRLRQEIARLKKLQKELIVENDRSAFLIGYQYGALERGHITLDIYAGEGAYCRWRRELNDRKARVRATEDEFF